MPLFDIRKLRKHRKQTQVCKFFIELAHEWKLQHQHWCLWPCR